MRNTVETCNECHRSYCSKCQSGTPCDYCGTEFCEDHGAVVCDSCGSFFCTECTPKHECVDAVLG